VSDRARPSQSDPAREPDQDRRYTLEELMEGSHGLLDASPHAVAGALSGLDRETHTLNQAKDAVAKFLKREVTS
jgi:hypothetical protein